MRMSCNGCRVLRKACGDDCAIRPCLQWIKSPDAQAHATVFLAKFYGRAGLLNLLQAGTPQLRPSIFRSMLYEACGRIVNPIYGSVGLLWSGNWAMCQAAVEAVLSGAPIVQIPSEMAASPASAPPLKACDIRHVARGSAASGAAGGADAALHRTSSRGKFKRAGRRKSVPGATTTRATPETDSEQAGSDNGAANLSWPVTPPPPPPACEETPEREVSTESHVTQEELEQQQQQQRQETPEKDLLELDLTLGLGWPWTTAAARTGCAA